MEWILECGGRKEGWEVEGGDLGWWWGGEGRKLGVVVWCGVGVVSLSLILVFLLFLFRVGVPWCGVLV